MERFSSSPFQRWRRWPSLDHYVHCSVPRATRYVHQNCIKYPAQKQETKTIHMVVVRCILPKAMRDTAVVSTNIVLLLRRFSSLRSGTSGFNISQRIKGSRLCAKDMEERQRGHQRTHRSRGSHDESCNSWRWARVSKAGGWRGVFISVLWIL